MISYEDAKIIAIEKTRWLPNANIDYAGELPTAYVFNDTKNSFDGGLPIVISKSDGAALNYWHFIHNSEYTANDIKEIKVNR